MSSKHLCNFIAVLNLGVRTKKNSIKIVLKNNFLKTFLGFIFKENFIHTYRLKKTGVVYGKKGTYRKEEEEATIFFRKNLIKKITLMSKPSYKKSISVYKLNSLHYKNGSRCVYILSTSEKGLITSYSCVKNNIGGLLICAIQFC
jgi:ribosomal protein S8